MLLNTTYPQTLTNGTVNGESLNGLGWMKESQLAEEIALHSGTLDKAQWRTLLAAIKCQLPVVVTTVDRGLGKERKTVMVSWASVGPDASTTHLRVHYWGFEHHLYVADILGIDTPEVEYAV